MPIFSYLQSVSKGSLKPPVKMTHVFQASTRPSIDPALSAHRISYRCQFMYGKQTSHHWQQNNSIVSLVYLCLLGDYHILLECTLLHTLYPEALLSTQGSGYLRTYG